MTQTMRRSQIYIVRTWIEELGDNQVELRGMVRNVQSGETKYFRSWDALVAFVNGQHDEVERSKSRPESTEPSAETSGTESDP